MAKTHGVFIGRFQPLHLGHQAVISEIMADGLCPIVIVGSPDIPRDKRNPYTLHERFVMLNHVYQNSIVSESVTNHPDNNVWAKDVIRTIELFCSPHEATLYYHRKAVDCSDEWEGKHYVDFLQGKIDIKHSEYATKLDLPICATDIRADIDSNKHFLDGRVYRLIAHQPLDQ